MHTWIRLGGFTRVLFPDQHTFQAETHDAPRYEKTLAPPIKYIHCTTNGTKQQPTAITLIKQIQ